MVAAFKMSAIIGHCAQ